MAGSIKPSFFITGPKEDLIVVDVYDPTDKLNTEETQTPSQGVENAADTLLRNTSTFAKSAVESISIKDGKVGIDTNEALKQVAGILGKTGGVQDLLGTNVTNSIMGALGVADTSAAAKAIELGSSGITGSDLAKAVPMPELLRYVLEDGGQEVSRLVKNADLDTATGVSNLLNAIGKSGALKVLNISAQFATLTGILDKAKDAGLLDALDIVIDKIEDAKDQKRFILDNLFRFFTSGDLLSINRALDRLGSGTVNARVPDGINMIMRYYRYPRQMQSADDKQELFSKQYKLLTGTLDRLNSNWPTVTWNENTIVNLEPYYHASSDAVAIFQSGSRVHYERCVLAKQYTLRSIQQYVSGQYPILELATRQ